MYQVALKPKYCACVSGGKDSLYMINVILNNLNKYPLDYVVHFDLDIDYPFIKNVVNSIELMCKKLNIPFIRFRPRKTWQDLYNKYDFPTRRVRWCNSKYKLDCDRQLKEWLASFGCRPVAYIGFCRDEEKRFKYELGNFGDFSKFIYPLAEENINEDYILNWAKTQDIFNDWYIYFRRCGCMLCPMLSRLELAYLKLYYPAYFDNYITYVKIWEKRFNNNFWNMSIDKVLNKIDTKYIPMLKNWQYTIFDFIGNEVL